MRRCVGSPDHPRSLPASSRYRVPDLLHRVPPHTRLLLFIESTLARVGTSLTAIA
jgi:hypothetical protein